MLTDNMDKIKDKMPAYESAIKDAVKRNEPEEVFKMIYDQATETTNVDGKEVSSRAATEEIFGKEMVQKAIDLHNNKTKANEKTSEAQAGQITEKPTGGTETGQPVGGAAASSKINRTCIQNRCGHDGQRKRVAHMPTATTTTEDSRSKLVQNHPLVCLKNVFLECVYQWRQLARQVEELERGC